MKSYTDLQQSKKLAEILPIESADMVLLHEEPYETSDSKFDGLHEVLCIQFIKYDKPTYRKKYKNIPYFPCWSLAALLAVLPEYNLQRTDWGNKTEYKIVVTTDEDSYASKNYDNPVDACVEMILKLHEFKML